MKTQTQYIKADIMCMSTEELDEIQFAIQMRRAAIGLNNCLLYTSDAADE